MLIMMCPFYSESCLFLPSCLSDKVTAHCLSFLLWLSFWLRSVSFVVQREKEWSAQCAALPIILIFVYEDNNISNYNQYFMLSNMLVNSISWSYQVLKEKKRKKKKKLTYRNLWISYSAGVLQLICFKINSRILAKSIHRRLENACDHSSGYDLCIVMVIMVA